MSIQSAFQGSPLKQTRARILVVEDEAEIRRLVVMHLQREGYQVDESSDGQQAMEVFKQAQFDLVVLDWMLPGISGLEFTRWIRAKQSTIPILFVTAKVEPEQIAVGLDAGADDYLTKPFDTLVLMARVNALLRRQTWLQNSEQHGMQPDKLQIGQLVVDRNSFCATLKGINLELTRSEFRLLELLLENQGRVLSREQIIDHIQGEGVNVVGRTVDTHVFGIRKKLGEYSELIETIRGVGYRIRFVDDLS